jgi:TPP-dependent pyruvate/acetoin dehydrogenase alpha subunit
MTKVEILPEKDKMIEMYRRMLEIRHFEEKVYYLFIQGVLPGTVHLYAGQEAVAVGVCSNLRKDDFITSTHRPHGHFIAKGGTLKQLMAELYAKKTGCSKAKGGSMHLCDLSVGMVPSSAIVAAGVPIAAGMGLAFKLKRTDQVVACFFGDGASNQGAWHEGLNLAAIWGLPVVFVCENNLYAASTRASTTMLVKNVADRASAYGIPGTVVDGNDVLAVYNVVHEAVKRARNGLGPTLVECLTYRHRGHSRGDPAYYRLKDEVEEWIKKDPIPRFRDKLNELNIVTKNEAEQIEKEVLTEVGEAVKFAETSPPPSPEEALQDVFA